jgi:kinesin family protein 6/9
LTIYIESRKFFAPVDDIGENVKSELKMSKIHFVDMAGTERLATQHQKVEGVNSAMAKLVADETHHINLSTTALGDVLQTLAKNVTSAKGKKLLVPYRTNKLTHYLKESFGGNCKVS